MGLEEKFDTEEKKEREIPNLKFIDLEIIKTLWDTKGTISVGEITKSVFKINGRRDLQKKYNRTRYRLNKLATEGIINKKSFEEGDSYYLSDSVFVGELNAKMDVMGEVQEMDFERAMFVKVDGTAMFVSLVNV